MSDFIFTSPYLPAATAHTWLKGNHHGHTTLSDGIDTPEATIAAYEAAEYDYLALSEHDRFADPADYQRLTGMMLVPAVEVTSSAGQTLMYLGAGAALPEKGTLALAEVMAFVSAHGGLFICDHPNWLYRPGRLHATAHELLEVDHLPAIEIYTGVIERMRGNPESVDVWDRLLSAGKRVFGHAVDDQHAPVDRFLGWNLVQWPVGEPVTAAGIIAALGAGRFVASTGVSVGSVSVSADGKTLSVQSDAEALRWIVGGGMLADRTAGGSGSLCVDDIPSLPRLAWYNYADPAPLQYVRIECIGRAGAKAWTQPFWVAARPG